MACPGTCPLRKNLDLMGTLALSVAGPRAPAHPLWQEGVFLSPQRLCVFP